MILKAALSISRLYLDLASEQGNMFFIIWKNVIFHPMGGSVRLVSDVLYCEVDPETLRVWRCHNLYSYLEITGLSAKAFVLLNEGRNPSQIAVELSKLSQLSKKAIRSNVEALIRKLDRYGIVDRQ